MRPVPTDFLRTAPHMERAALLKHYRVGGSTLTRWLRETGVQIKTKPRPSAQKHVPEDFLTFAPGKPVTALVAHYGACDSVVRRWLRESDIRLPVYRPQPPTRGQAGTPRKSVINGMGEMTQASIAAHHLMRHFSSVWSAKILEPHQRKAKNLQPTDWFVAGKGFLPVEAMIDMARQHGFGA